MTPSNICNLALAKLGDEAKLSSINPPDGSMQAQYCALYYPQALSVLLSKQAWSFALQTVALTPQPLNTHPFWAYAYTLPADFFNLLAVRPAGFSDSLQWPQRPGYALESGVLYCNLPDAVLVYTCNQALAAGYDTGQLPPLFVEALAVLLAAYLAGPILKGDEGVAAQGKMLQLFGLALKQAGEADAQARSVRPLYWPAALSARHGLGLAAPGLAAYPAALAYGPV